MSTRVPFISSIDLFTLKVTKDKNMISPMLITVSKASSGTFDDITLLYWSAQKGQVVGSSLHWQGAGSRNLSPGWEVGMKGKAGMDSFDSFRSWLLFYWSPLRKDHWRPHATAVALAGGKLGAGTHTVSRNHSSFLSKAKDQRATITCRYYCCSAVGHSPEQSKQMTE